LSNVKFPRIHIAESVVNRILNTYDEIELSRQPVEPPTMPEAPPTVPDPAVEGAVLQGELMQPSPPVSGPELEQADITSTVLAGDDLVSML